MIWALRRGVIWPRVDVTLMKRLTWLAAKWHQHASFNAYVSHSILWQKSKYHFLVSQYSKTSRPVVLSRHMPYAQVGCDEGRLCYFCVFLSSKSGCSPLTPSMDSIFSPSNLLLTWYFCFSNNHIWRSLLRLNSISHLVGHDHIIGCPRMSLFSMMKISTKVK